MHLSDAWGNVPMNWIMLSQFAINLAQELECKSKPFLQHNKFMKQIAKVGKIR